MDAVELPYVIATKTQWVLFELTFFVFVNWLGLLRFKRLFLNQDISDSAHHWIVCTKFGIGFIGKNGGTVLKEKYFL